MAIRFGRAQIIQLMSTDGAGGGTSDATGDYSSTALSLRCTPPPNRVYELTRVLVSIEDAGNFNANTYGAVTALSPGITADVSDSDGVLYTLSAFSITQNSDWDSHCHDAVPTAYNAGNTVLAVRWTWGKGGQPVTLDGSRGQFVQFTIDGNCTGLVHHRYLVHGTVANVGV